MIFNNYPVNKTKLKKLGEFNFTTAKTETININHSLYDELIIEVTGTLAQSAYMQINDSILLENGNLRTFKNKYYFNKELETADYSTFTNFSMSGGGVAVGSQIKINYAESYYTGTNITVTVYAVKRLTYGK